MKTGFSPAPFVFRTLISETTHQLYTTEVVLFPVLQAFSPNGKAGYRCARRGARSGERRTSVKSRRTNQKSFDCARLRPSSRLWALLRRMDFPVDFFRALRVERRARRARTATIPTERESNSRRSSSSASLLCFRFARSPPRSKLTESTLWIIVQVDSQQKSCEPLLRDLLKFVKQELRRKDYAIRKVKHSPAHLTALQQLASVVACHRRITRRQSRCA